MLVLHSAFDIECVLVALNKMLLSCVVLVADVIHVSYLTSYLKSSILSYVLTLCGVMFLPNKYIGFSRSLSGKTALWESRDTGSSPVERIARIKSGFHFNNVLFVSY